jgi:hypothetical protein
MTTPSSRNACRERRWRLLPWLGSRPTTAGCPLKVASVKFGQQVGHVRRGGGIGAVRSAATSSRPTHRQRSASGRLPRRRQ